jgi:hypothetical protein
MHGTFVDGRKLSAEVAEKLTGGESVRFGIEIMQRNMLFPPETVKIEYDFTLPEQNPR